MRQTNALKQLLEDLTAVYNDGERIEVQLAKPDETSSASADGSHVTVAPNVRQIIGRNLSGPNELRVITNVLSHEVEHIRESVLTGKRDFSTEYPATPKLAGAVINIVEDQYVDWSRTSRFRGLKKSHAFVIDQLMQNHDRRPRVDKLDGPGAYVETLLQVAFAGYAKHITEADDDIREFAARVRPLIDTARRDPDPAHRERIAHEVMSVLYDYLDMPDYDDVEAYAETLPIRPLPGDGNAQPGDNEDSTDETAASPTDNGDTDSPGIDVDDLDLDLDADADDSGSSGSNVDSRPMTDAEIQAQIDQMEAQDASRRDSASAPWYGLDESTSNYADPDEFDVRRYERLQRKIKQNEDDVEVRKRERDERLERDNENHRCHSDNIRSKMRKDGLSDDIERAFRELKTRDRMDPARSGHRVNTRAFNRFKAGNRAARRELYMRRHRAELGDRAIGVSLDLSGSMNEQAAKIALVGLWTAVDAIGDDFTASAFFEDNGHVQTPLITAPDEAFEWDHLDSVSSKGGTPTASGMADVLELLKQTSKPDKVLVVITDGQANYGIDGRWGGGRAKKDAAAIARHARAKGVKVIGLGVNMSDEKYLADIFGDDYLLTDMDNLAETLIQIYNRQMKVDEAKI